MGSSSTPHAAAGRFLYLLLGTSSSKNITHSLFSSSSRYHRYRNPRRVMSTSSSKESNQFQFSSKIRIPPSHVFYETPLSFAFVNIKPVVPGHVLVVPKRIVEKFEEMTTEEITDVMSTSQRVSKAVKKIHSANSMTLTVQDGEDAGQTVFHVHVHVMPRKPNDFARNDDVYEKLEKCEEEERKARMDFAEDGEERTPRGEEEMEKEATELRRAMTMEESYSVSDEEIDN
ncbi:unnamed protein product [Bathycoccus prasinos]